MIELVAAGAGECTRCGLIGWPVEHSLSPRLHTHAAKLCGIPFSYEASAVPPGDACMAVRRSKAAGMRGINVTTPHKEAVIEVLTKLDGAASTILAVNTISFDADGSAIGFNTDYSGAVKLFTDYLPGLGGISPNQPCLILGTGPAARAIAMALRKDHARETIMLTRAATDRARSFARQHDIGLVQMDDAQAFALLKDADVLVNATPLGTGRYAQQSPLPDGVMACPRAMAMDLNYLPLFTRFLQDSRHGNCLVLNGLALLAYQAAECFNIWTGEEVTGPQLIEFLQSEGYEITLPDSW